MILYSSYFDGIDDTTLAYATHDDWIPIPGPTMMISGPDTILEVPNEYDWIVVDPLSTPNLRRQMSLLTDCYTGERDPRMRAYFLPTTQCFKTGLLKFEGHGIRFQVPSTQKMYVNPTNPTNPGSS